MHCATLGEFCDLAWQFLEEYGRANFGVQHLPFGFSVHRDTHFYPSRPFGFSTCRVYKFFVLSQIFARTSLVRRDALVFPRCVNLSGLLCVVSFDYVRVRRVRQVVTIHGGQNHRPTGEYVFNYKWSFIGRGPFSPGITLW